MEFQILNGQQVSRFTVTTLFLWTSQNQSSIKPNCTVQCYNVSFQISCPLLNSICRSHPYQYQQVEVTLLDTLHCFFFNITLCMSYLLIHLHYCFMRWNKYCCMELSISKFLVLFTTLLTHNFSIKENTCMQLSIIL